MMIIILKVTYNCICVCSTVIYKEIIQQRLSSISPHYQRNHNNNHQVYHHHRRRCGDGGSSGGLVNSIWDVRQRGGQIYYEGQVSRATG